MSELKDLYQDIIFEHNRQPRNRGVMVDSNFSAQGANPVCGDQLTVYLKINANDIIEAISYEGEGCAISTASASMMSEYLIGKSLAKAKLAFDEMQLRLTAKESADIESNAIKNDFGDLEALIGVRAFPARIKCATLPWQTLYAAFSGANQSVSTE